MPKLRFSCSFVSRPRWCPITITVSSSLPLEGLDGLGNAELAIARGFLDLVDLPFQLGDRLLEFELCC